MITLREEEAGTSAPTGLPARRMAFGWRPAVLRLEPFPDPILRCPVIARIVRRSAGIPYGAGGPPDHFAMRNPSVPLDASTTIIPSNAMNAIEYGAALRRSVDSDPGSLIAVAAIARF